MASLFCCQQRSWDIVGGKFVGMARDFFDPGFEIPMEDFVDHVCVEAVVYNSVQREHVVHDGTSELSGVSVKFTV